MIPIGATVRWAPAVCKRSKDEWTAEVLGHPRSGVVLITGGSRISESLLEVVGMHNPLDDLPTVKEMWPDGGPMEIRDRERAERAALRAEVAALTALVVEQAEALAEMVPAPTHDEQQHLEDVEAFADNAAAYMEAYLSAVCGQSRPRVIVTPELKALADFIFEGVQ